METLSGVVTLLLIVVSATADLTLPRHPSQRELRYVVQEELLIGSDVADVADDARLVDRYGPEVARSSLRFRFLATPLVPVAVDERTGRVRTTGRLDREAICGEGGEQMDLCLDRLDVVVQPMNYFQIIKVRPRYSIIFSFIDHRVGLLYRRYIIPDRLLCDRSDVEHLVARPASKFPPNGLRRPA